MSVALMKYQKFLNNCCGHQICPLELLFALLRSEPLIAVKVPLFSCCEPISCTLGHMQISVKTLTVEASALALLTPSMASLTRCLLI